MVPTNRAERMQPLVQALSLDVIHGVMCLMLCRLATIQAARGDTAQAAAELGTCNDFFMRRLGPDNPLSGESSVALSLVKLGQLLAQSKQQQDPYSKVLAPKQKAELLSSLQRGLQAMQKGFGRTTCYTKRLCQNTML